MHSLLIGMVIALNPVSAICTAADWDVRGSDNYCKCCNPKCYIGDYYNYNPSYRDDVTGLTKSQGCRCPPNMFYYGVDDGITGNENYDCFPQRSTEAQTKYDDCTKLATGGYTQTMWGMPYVRYLANAPPDATLGSEIERGTRSDGGGAPKLGCSLYYQARTKRLLVWWTDRQTLVDEFWADHKRVVKPFEIKSWPYPREDGDLVAYKECVKITSQSDPMTDSYLLYIRKYMGAPLTTPFINKIGQSGSMTGCSLTWKSDDQAINVWWALPWFELRPTPYNTTVKPYNCLLVAGMHINAILPDSTYVQNLQATTQKTHRNTRKQPRQKLPKLRLTQAQQQSRHK